MLKLSTDIMGCYYNFMNKRLNYEQDARGFSVTAPKDLIDSTTSRRGPLLDELRQPPSRQLIERSRDGGLMRLSVDTDKIGGNTAAHWAQEERAERVLEAIFQLDGVAFEEEDGHDLRVRTRHLWEDGGMRLQVNFERPVEEGTHLASTALQAIRHHGRKMGFFRGSGNSVDEDTRAVYAPDSLITFGASGRHGSSALVSSRSRLSDRYVELREAEGVVSYRAQLATLMGVYAILPNASRFSEDLRES